MLACVDRIGLSLLLQANVENEIVMEKALNLFADYWLLVCLGLVIVEVFIRCRHYVRSRRS